MRLFSIAYNNNMGCSSSKEEDKDLRVMQQIHLEIQDKERDMYGSTYQEAIDGQTVGEMSHSAVVPGYRNKALVDHNNRILEVQKKSTGTGSVTSIEEYRDLLIGKGFTAEEADRLAREDMGQAQDNHTPSSTTTTTTTTATSATTNTTTATASASTTTNSAAAAEFSDPKFKKYRLMRSSGVDNEGIRSAMGRNRIAEDVIDRFIALLEGESPSNNNQ